MIGRIIRFWWKLLRSAVAGRSALAGCGVGLATLFGGCAGGRPGASVSGGGTPPVLVQQLAWFDAARQRSVPVTLYLADTAAGRRAAPQRAAQKVAILNHGYGSSATAYSFLARLLVAHGYVVASVQHELPGDAPLPPASAHLYQDRLPSWERGAANILFVRRQLRRTRPRLDYRHLLLLGHSHGGDMVALLAGRQPRLAAAVITLDNRRVPLPRRRHPRMLTLRSSDQPADPGVLPSAAEQRRFRMRVVPLPATLHNDMWDGASPAQQAEMSRVIAAFLGEPTGR
ncbi:alpha/beta hydrolase [Hymenobacter sp. 15J16-1T3B]|uniref:serine aminopeptidase domain-containing protein n=1 Tax=Hymenobacter sp. 15J16-1T3B TaxID=2886941 RepID=UPI001D0FB0B7|nr:alpha/beta hydrolase [Hymenobacter sp. 15J16-1T3B]MCC3160642.1 alpha/beta hydrolase [Hymenobacter sp. 15J16-1T3B]